MPPPDVLARSPAHGRGDQDNIRYSRPDATEEDIVASAKAVGAGDFIRRFPERATRSRHAKGAGAS